MQERLQLAGAVLERRGRQLAELPELTPLLRFTRGNPLTILVTMGEALRAGIDTSARLDAFVTALRGGEVDFADEASEGRSKSLGASLSYGFDTAFTDDERKVLALLHLFQVFINVDVLRAMGNPKAEWCLAHVRGLTRDRGIALLDRAAEIGLLHAHGNGYYGIHPALPWYFSALFSRDFSDDSDGARRAFAGAMGQLGDSYHNIYHNGRRLVTDVVLDFIDPVSNGPLAGREDDWSLVTEYRVRLASKERDWLEAERLQQIRVSWDRQRAQNSLAVTAGRRDGPQRHAIQTLGTSLQELANIQRERGNPACTASYREALDLATAVGERVGQAACAFNLGHAYKDIIDLA